LAPQLVEAATHISQPVASRERCRRVESRAIVFDLDLEVPRTDFQPNPNLGSGGVFDDVMNGLFAGHIQMVARFGGQGCIRKHCHPVTVRRVSWNTLDPSGLHRNQPVSDFSMTPPFLARFSQIMLAKVWACMLAKPFSLN
jgi:hypothetical protein